MSFSINGDFAGVHVTQATITNTNDYTYKLDGAVFVFNLQEAPIHKSIYPFSMLLVQPRVNQGQFATSSQDSIHEFKKEFQILGGFPIYL